MTRLIGLALCLTVVGCAARTPSAPAPAAATAATAAPSTPSATPRAAPSAAPASTPTGAAPPAAPPAPTPRVDPLRQLRQDLLAATQSPGLQRGAWGVVVQSLDRNERLFELNPRTLLVPASVAKLVAVATAADAVGWDHRWETTIRAMGPIADGVLQGDLVVAGSGDPALGGRAGDDPAALIVAIRAHGISRILGRIVGDDNALEEPRPQLAWAWDDLGYPTGAIFGALNINENRAAIRVVPSTPGAQPGLAVPPSLGHRQIVNRAVTVAADAAQLLWPEQRPGETALTIAGTIAEGAPTATVNVAVGNPTLHFAQVLRQRLIASGIDVGGTAADIDDVGMAAPAAGTEVVSYRSRPLAEIVQPLLKDSINLYAEAVMRLNAQAGGPLTNDAALDGVRKRLESWGVQSADQQIVDGSGLSRRDVITADAVLAILSRMHGGGSNSPFVTALPVAGVDGSLANRMRGTPAAGNVRAKTGTMSNVRSLAGYVTTADGERLAFVAMVNNFEGTGAQANQALDAIAVRLAEFRRP